jgi:uncharacterized membrane protein
MVSEKRPVIKIAYSKAEKILEVVSIILIALNLYILIRYYNTLPDTIPKHFNGAGVPDAFGNKSGILFIPILVLGMYILFTVLSKFPQAYNYPMEINEENAEFQYKAARAMMIVIKAEIVGCFTYVEFRTVMVALGKAKGLGIGFLPVFLVLVFGTIIVYMVKTLKSK